MSTRLPIVLFEPALAIGDADSAEFEVMEDGDEEEPTTRTVQLH